jgi:hypothetical protein
MTFQGNFFIHGWPYHPDGTPVATAFSGGCIRLADEDAKTVYDLAEVGMPVLVFEKDFAPDGFFYHSRTPDVGASAYFAADIKNNFVFLEKGSKDQISFGGFSQVLGALVATDYINIEKKIVLDAEVYGDLGDENLTYDMEVTPFDLLHLGLVATSTAPTLVFEKILGVKRFAALMNDKARAVGMTATKGDMTVPEDLFYLSKYIYNNRNFLFKISAGDLKNNTYGESKFKNVENGNIFSNDPIFLGGKATTLLDGTESFMGVFAVEMNGEKRPIFIFLTGSPSVVNDVPNILQYIRNYYQ